MELIDVYHSSTHLCTYLGHALTLLQVAFTLLTSAFPERLGVFTLVTTTPKQSLAQKSCYTHLLNETGLALDGLVKTLEIEYSFYF